MMYVNFCSLQTKFGHLQRKHEQTEMDLIDARMLAASFDDFDEDEVDGKFDIDAKYVFMLSLYLYVMTAIITDISV